MQSDIVKSDLTGHDDCPNNPEHTKGNGMKRDCLVYIASQKSIYVCDWTNLQTSVYPTQTELTDIFLQEIRPRRSRGNQT